MLKDPEGIWELCIWHHLDPLLPGERDPMLRVVSSLWWSCFPDSLQYEKMGQVATLKYGVCVHIFFTMEDVVPSDLFDLGVLLSCCSMGSIGGGKLWRILTIAGSVIFCAVRWVSCTQLGGICLIKDLVGFSLFYAPLNFAGAEIKWQSSGQIVLQSIWSWIFDAIWDNPCQIMHGWRALQRKNCSFTLDICGHTFHLRKCLPLCA